MSLAPRIERSKNRRKRNEKRPVQLFLEMMEDRTVPAQAIAVGPDLSLIGVSQNSGAKVGDTLFFLAHQTTDAPGVSEIWQVSGTATAQEVSVPALAGMSIDEITSVNGALYVTAAPVSSDALPTAPASANLWKIDPTATGGAIELTNFAGSSAVNLQAVGNEVLFDHTSVTGSVPARSSDELWASDGTVAGTQLVFAFKGDAHPDLVDSAVAGSDLYFQVNAYVSPAQPALWVSDGTAAGTQVVAATGGGALPPLNGFSLTALGDAVYFATSNSNQANLWKAVNGQASVVQSFVGNPASAFVPQIDNLSAANGSIYFALSRATGTEVWTSDGTTAGTIPVYQPAAGGATPPGSYVGDIAVLNGSVYFTEVNGDGLMKADGKGGAAPVTLPSDLSGFSYLSAVGNRIYFVADDGVHGTELWSTDGANDTARLTDINPGSGSSFPIGPEEAGGSLYVVASNGVPSSPTNFAPEQLWLLPDPSAPAGATATTTLNSAANAVITGGTVTLTATVTAADSTQTAPTGQVVFRDDLQIYGSAPIINGIATLNAIFNIPGGHTLQAVYTGDGVFDESISAPITVTAGPSSTTLALTTTDATADPGESVTFTATITPALNSILSPTGSVNFFDGTKFLGTGSVNAGIASFQTSALAKGTHSITANYSGDNVFLPSESAPLTETVGPVFTVSLTGPLSSTSLGQPITLSAHVSPTPGGIFPPGMSVVFRDAATPLGSATVDALGHATLTVSSLGVGQHSLSAVVFNQGVEYDSTAIDVTVKQAATSAILRSTAPTARQGQTITLTMVLTTPTGTPAPTGTVTFTDGPAVLGAANVANNRAVLLVSNLVAGNHPITATYAGDANYISSSATLTQTVTSATVATTIIASASSPSAITGQTIDLSATILPAVGNTTPVGSVAFMDGKAPLGSVKIDPSGHALLLINSLGTGNHTITAVFGGSGIFAGSTSTPITVAVRLGANASLASNATHITSGQTVSLTATVTPTAGGAVQPAGNVTFYDGSKALGSATIQNGVAKLNTAPISTVGVHDLRAVYGGNALFGSVSTGTVYVTVRAIATTITIQPLAAPAAGTGIVTIKATVGVVAPGTGSATGKVTFYDGTTTLGTAKVVNGLATLQLPKLAAGSHYIRAVFVGASPDAGSTSAVVHYTIAATTSTTLHVPAAAFGQTTVLKATVAVLSPGFGKANGKVTFMDGATILGSASLINGIATLDVKLSTGPHSLSADYVGTSDFVASAAIAMPYTVTKAAPTLSLKASPGSPKAGANVTIHVDVDPASAGAAAPTGTVLLTDGTTIMGVGTIAHGVVTLQTNKLTKGAHTLKALYSGDGNYAAETTSLSLTVA